MLHKEDLNSLTGAIILQQRFRQMCLDFNSLVLFVATRNFTKMVKKGGKACDVLILLTCEVNNAATDPTA